MRLAWFFTGGKLLQVANNFPNALEVSGEAAPILARSFRCRCCRNYIILKHPIPDSFPANRGNIPIKYLVAGPDTDAPSLLRV